MGLYAKAKQRTVEQIKTNSGTSRNIWNIFKKCKAV